MNIDRTIAISNFELDTKTGTQFEALLETTNHISNDSFEYDQDELKNLSNVDSSYLLGEKFAEGGQGIILTATDKLLKRFVAIKSLKKIYTKIPEVVDSFISEAIVTAQLDHPCIIPLYGINKDEEDGLHLSMKLVLGKTLKEITEEDRNNAKQVALEAKALIRRLEYFTCVCDALSYAHEKKILHRDLKPDNIMVGAHHDVYVMDWGIAKVFDEKKDKEGKNLISGTAGYIAPEILRQETYGAASDQYALGVILYELFTLKSALTSATVKLRLMDTVKGNLPKFVHFNSKVKLHPDLISICKKACDLEPKERYPNVDALANDIRLFISKQEVSARPDNLLRKSYRFIAKNRHLATSLILIILLLSAGLSIHSLKKQNDLIESSKIRELKLVDLRSAIEYKSHKIDTHFNSLSNILNRYTDRVKFLMETKNKPQKQAIRSYKEFKQIETLHSGTVESPFYKQLINPNYLIYKLAPGLKFETVQEKISSFGDMVDYSLELMGNSQLNSDNSGLKKKIINTGLPMCWLYLGLEEGVIINYPANGALQDSYDPRLRGWYKTGKAAKKLVWTEPYNDLFGLGKVISAVQPIYSRSNKFLGVTAFDLTLNYTKKIMNSGKVNSSLIGNYLIDQKGEIIVSGKDSEIHKTLKMNDLLKHIKKGSIGQYEINHNGCKIVVDYAAIPTLSWYYIELIDIKKYLSK